VFWAKKPKMEMRGGIRRFLASPPLVLRLLWTPCCGSFFSVTQLLHVSVARVVYQLVCSIPWSPVNTPCAALTNIQLQGRVAMLTEGATDSAVGVIS
jgi:hypothetical protein